MKKDKYLLSIIIPVYNTERYLKECLDSIFDDSTDFVSNVEVIIIDDGSVDKSSDIYNKYEKLHGNMKVIKHENHGVSFSRNCGIKEATGKYLMFVDSDDMLLKGWSEKIYKEIVSDEYDVIFHSKYFLKAYDDNLSKSEILSYILTYNDKNIRISGPYSKLFKRTFVIENNIKFKEDLINGEDMIYNVETLLRSTSQLLVKDSYYIVRHNAFSATSYFNDKIINSEVSFNKYIKNIFNDYKDYDSNYIEKVTFLASVRILSYRISLLSKYFVAKEKFREVRNNDFFSNGFRHYKLKVKSKSSILFYLFKYKLYLIIFLLCKNKKSRKDFLEIL